MSCNLSMKYDLISLMDIAGLGAADVVMPLVTEDLILAALVLEQGLKKGYRPSIGGKRCVTPGSLPIIAKLRRIGLVKFYEQAGFEIGTLTELREIWLSSQNQNFRNRMGKGVIGNLASTATVAVSSFEMKIKDPRELLDLIDPEKYKEFLEQWVDQADPNNPSSLGSYLPPPPPSFTGSITGKVQVFEDNIPLTKINHGSKVYGIDKFTFQKFQKSNEYKKQS
ncbi:hypothetical protein Glove_19g326 [Diversispora epigaea]|uniref:Aconitase/3-isopropylmalate dehydratase large subunit alpha/beta/alpha domain-containing protein n=1 Tax=Diversispora epigaea TaxID=1348612 RepID=A0A397JN33_9GLOM|nr:hypothetical protein Glove_19g326 [Diversispora epigaea]